ncbi:MAG: PIN domain-containing protein [Crocosphaera sp.]
MTKNYRIYMDVCCFNRPFDDWSQLRIRLEAEAILTIINYFQTEDWLLISSIALDSEIEQTPDLERKQQVKDLLTLAQTKIPLTEVIQERTKTLVTLGFKSFDALHLAYAESGIVDVFLTTDDRLLNKATLTQAILKVPVKNPISWLMEQSND